MYVVLNIKHVTTVHGWNVGVVMIRLVMGDLPGLTVVEGTVMNHPFISVCPRTNQIKLLCIKTVTGLMDGMHTSQLPW